ncbi:PEX28-32 family peroxisomal membrane protein [Aspergillus clavatus NRRL 1]|uniref:Integral peroxisomal membrane peroxin, putative n=1 Tax=Aspergillus clavatus (strain ATCC 1007 / CBS 513.65 / DSM 816 / NCTC 3887 / NRRL 1 / QM 1276 / 107) TaxID=344612 RepID=A1CFJ4_ASPCL|nr:integral peroxisomal membrane peroxin, putative [Aspergillus clavatus NRRL 1]EAW11643.1 integral peroxisomal membrane peroxin, putative [Aspergillus clavatus NRRL 1]
MADDGSTGEVFAIRDKPIPVISVGKHDSAAKDGTSHRRHERSGSLQDKLFAKILEQVIPGEDGDNESAPGADKRIAADVKRPAFSLPLMANNFRRFNARIGIVFHFQNQAEQLFSWRQSSHTFSFLFVYSFICLDPHLLAILPITIILLFVMVPAFAARHPPPPSTSTSSTTPYYSYQGPALAPAKTIKPASETSKDFFRNMRDLQNVMADFSDMHDATVSLFAPMTNFSNEKLASTVFLLLTITVVLLFLTAHLLPWRFILLLGGNAAILSNHPGLQDFLQSFAGDKSPVMGNKPATVSHEEPKVADVPKLSLPSNPSAAVSLLGSLADISLDTYPEEREVEIFEIQNRSLAPYSESEWDNFIFSPVPYDPLSPSRIAGDRPRGCRFFEDVQPPPGWAWKTKKWKLDLDCREWVVERMITGVGFEIPGAVSERSATNEQIGGWVWDLPSQFGSRDEDAVATALGYQDFGTSSTQGFSNETQKAKKGKQKLSSRDWEEHGNSGFNGMGEWRRRRWVRVVQRVGLSSETEKSPNRDKT